MNLFHQLSMSKFVVIVFSVLLDFQYYSAGAQQINYAGQGCRGHDGNYTQGSVYQQNLNQLFIDLTSQTLVNKFYNSSTGDVPNKVYGLYHCREDLSLDNCRDCIRDATRQIVQVCPFYGEAVIWYNECMLRYANRSIYSLMEIYPAHERSNELNYSNNDQFIHVLGSTLHGVINLAAPTTRSGHFGTLDANFSLFQRVYCLAQCTPDINEFDCNNCLRDAMAEMNACCRASVRVRVFKPSCHLRYDMSQFYNVTTLLPAPPTSNIPVDKPKGKGSKTPIIAGIAVGASAGILLLLIALWYFVRRSRKVLAETPKVKPPEAPNKSEYSQGDEAGDLGSVEFTQYDFAILEAATENFSSDNKLGEGGFGIVYKGTLSNGQAIAIKRLSGNSGQGEKEFMTEARIVAKLQHKNLVKLLGFCSHREEKMLVYEFLPNTSVDRFLFDPRKRALLDWETRYKIIMGIARGLQYLHEDSRLTIIHRDLKPSNILLDIDMNPKIADFGMAKLFGGGQLHGNTSRIVGTHGYMAPEYMLTGEYSDKSDVYSFGILLLELVSGQKNRIMYQPSQNEDISILAWRLWNEGRSIELMDPTLYKSTPRSEVMRCIQIGMLCVQANAVNRPTTTAIVLMLTGSVALPLPSTPIMSPHHYNMSMFENDRQQNEPNKSFSKTVTWTADVEQDLYPR